MRRLAFVALAAVPAAALAHAGHDHGQAPGWEFDPLVVVPLLIALVIFLVGQRQLEKQFRELKFFYCHQMAIQLRQESQVFYISVAPM